MRSSNTKTYRVDNTLYTFEVLNTLTTRRGTMWLGKCTRTGKEAWLDECGFQFDGAKRIPAQLVNNYQTDSSLRLWGGELRDKLPHGARYYMNGRRK